MKIKLLIFILVVVSAGGSVIYFSKNKSLPVVEQNIEPITIAPAENFSSSSQEILKENLAEATATTTEEITQPEIAASLIINGEKIDTVVTASSSVYDLMEKLKSENKINFFGKNYSGLGFFVEEINGVKNDQLNRNWIYYVNGRSAPVGVSNYFIKQGDIIEWKYSPR